jgi:hypothetical protein
LRTLSSRLPCSIMQEQLYAELVARRVIISTINFVIVGGLTPIARADFM